MKVTSANEHDVTVVPNLLTGEKRCMVTVGICGKKAEDIVKRGAEVSEGKPPN